MGFRAFYQTFWSDPFIEELSAEEKLLYIYMFTNAQQSNIGVFEITNRKISFETGVQTSSVEIFLAKMERLGKIVRDGGAVLVLNFVKHQSMFGKDVLSPKLKANLCKLFAELEHPLLCDALCKRYPAIFPKLDRHDIPHVKGTDMQPIPSPKGSDTLSIPHAKGTDTLSANNNTIHDKTGDYTHTEPVDLSKLDPAPVSAKGVCVSFSPEDVEEAKDGIRREAEAVRQEFDELREAYKAVRDDGPMAGWPEYQQARRSKGWPGLLFVLDRLQTLIEQDDQWKRGYKEGLRRFLTDRMWEMEPRKAAPAPNADPEPTDAEKAAKEKGDRLLAELKAREAQKRKLRGW